MMTDIDVLATRGKLSREEEKSDRDSRTEFPITEFEENFDELFERVEEGEILTILHDNGQKVMMVPTKCLIGSTPRNGSN